MTAKTIAITTTTHCISHPSILSQVNSNHEWTKKRELRERRIPPRWQIVVSVPWFGSTPELNGFFLGPWYTIPQSLMEIRPAMIFVTLLTDKKQTNSTENITSLVEVRKKKKNINLLPNMLKSWIDKYITLTNKAKISTNCKVLWIKMQYKCS